jgi:hypothetical protein
VAAGRARQRILCAGQVELIPLLQVQDFRQLHHLVVVAVVHTKHLAEYLTD